MSEPFISVFMATYNHAPFIDDAIEAVMAQETEYSLELIICDDFSTDGTREKIQRMSGKYPNIVVSFQPHNTRGVRNMMQGFSLVRGKYLAMCEGDDYWTDPAKLQTQVAFLEKNPDFTVSTHKVSIAYADAPNDALLPRYIYKDCVSDEQRVRNGIFYADEVVDNYYMHTSSMVFRWKFRNGLPDFFRVRMLLDHFLLLLHAAEGKIKYFDRPMSVWRRHVNSYSYAQLHDKGLFFQKEGEDWLDCYYEIDKYFNGRFHYQIRERMLLALRALTDHCMSSGQYDQLRWLFLKYRNIIEKPVLQNDIIGKAWESLFSQARQFCPPWSTESSSREEIPIKPVLDLDNLSISRSSLWDKWTADTGWSSFSSHLSAVAAYCFYHGINTVWLPDLCSQLFVDVLKSLQIAAKFYNIDLDMKPDAGFLQLCRNTDLVLSFDSFGGEDAEFQSAIAQTGLRHLLEICSSPDSGSMASAKIYDLSWYGAPYGALLAGAGVEIVQPTKKACLSRIPLAGSYLKKRESELSMQLPGGPAPKLSIDVVKRTAFADAVSKRKVNWQYLKSKLPGLSWLDKTSVSQAAFALRLPGGMLVSAFIGELAKDGIEAQRIYIPSGRDVGCYARAISDQLVYLPCAQHLQHDELDYIAGKVMAVLENRNNAISESQRAKK